MSGGHLDPDHQRKGWLLILRLDSPLAPYFSKRLAAERIMPVIWHAVTYSLSRNDGLTSESTRTESTRETPVLELLASVTADSIAASSLDPRTLMLVRVAALEIAVDAPSVSYLMNLAASEVGIDAKRVRGVSRRDRADRRPSASRVRDRQIVDAHPAQRTHFRLLTL
jgi:hypothetical protein